MASLFSRLGLTISFPEYQGPYSVGTVDVEIAAAEIAQPASSPEDAKATIAFRIFYPCEKPTPAEADRPVRWICEPQRPNVAAFARFMGLSERKASLASFILQQIYWTKLPAHRNATLLQPPTSTGRWPVAFFSHGLGSGRNTYSYICGSLASNGIVVIAMDHRDGSSPVQYIRATKTSEACVQTTTKIGLGITDEAYAARDKQLRIRLWEESTAFEAMTQVDLGTVIENLDPNLSKHHKGPQEVLARFVGKLDIHRPGKVAWVGHSFGAATTVQLVKSIYYSDQQPPQSAKPLIMPKRSSSIVKQITPQSPVLILDMWAEPLRSPATRYLLEYPSPSYAVDGPKGSNLIAILSEGFYKWETNRNYCRSVVSPPPSSQSKSSGKADSANASRTSLVGNLGENEGPDSGYVSTGSRSSTPSASRRPTVASLRLNTTRKGITTQPGPHMYYVTKSQHANHSDFGALFGWIAVRFGKMEDAGYIFELNIRAMLQVLREAGLEVAGNDDPAILDKKSEIARWIPVDVENVADTGLLAKPADPDALVEADRQFVTSDEVAQVSE